MRDKIMRKGEKLAELCHEAKGKKKKSGRGKTVVSNLREPRGIGFIIMSDLSFSSATYCSARLSYEFILKSDGICHPKM
jgi:hypothetical protein